MINDLHKGEDIFTYINRVKGGFDHTLYQQVIGASNDFKEGDLTIGVGAKDIDLGRSVGAWRSRAHYIERPGLP
jgi:ethanolamine ammonia-lyase large subunit